MARQGLSGPPGGEEGGSGGADSGADGARECESGETRCWGTGQEVCVDGEWTQGQCDGICVDELGCVACEPGARSCDGNTIVECDDDGSAATTIHECDSEAGERCTGGFCQDSCQEALENRSTIGCEYWAVDLDNAENRIPMDPRGGDNAAGAQFAVAVANPDPYLSAHVTVEINVADLAAELDLEIVADVELGPGGIEVLELPRRDADGENITTFVDDGPQTHVSSRAFRVTSTAPIVAYQFNTLDQQYSNDASLLLPTSGLDRHHIVLSYPPTNAVRFPGMPVSRSYVTVIGTEVGTRVEITPTSRTLAGGTVPALEPGQTFEVELGPFDMLNLETDSVTFQEAAGGTYPDLTGTVVTSSKPVAVFTGCDLTVVVPQGADPDEDGRCCAEHIESQILPTSAMGTSFAVSRSPQRSRSTPEPDVYRILAVVDDTVVTTNLSGADGSFELDAGEFHQLDATTGFVLETNADHPVHVGQFLISQTFVGDRVIGDPAFLLFPALGEWRGTYVFTTGVGFQENHVVVTMAEGSEVFLDGNMLPDLASGCTNAVPIGAIDGVDYVQISCPILDGAHGIESDEAAVGAAVYGYYHAGSYAYSAGSNLTRIFLI